MCIRDRYYRFTALGYKIGRINDYVYHLEHERGANSWFSNPHMHSNMQLWNTLGNMGKKELLKYYSEQEYLKKYVSI